MDVRLTAVDQHTLLVRHDNRFFLRYISHFPPPNSSFYISICLSIYLSVSTWEYLVLIESCLYVSTWTQIPWVTTWDTSVHPVSFSLCYVWPPGNTWCYRLYFLVGSRPYESTGTEISWVTTWDTNVLTPPSSTSSRPWSSLRNTNLKDYIAWYLFHFTPFCKNKKTIHMKSLHYIYIFF